MGYIWIQAFVDLNPPEARRRLRWLRVSSRKEPYQSRSHKYYDFHMCQDVRKKRSGSTGLRSLHLHIQVLWMSRVHYSRWCEESKRDWRWEEPQGGPGNNPLAKGTPLTPLAFLRVACYSSTPPCVISCMSYVIALKMNGGSVAGHTTKEESTGVGIDCRQPGGREHFTTAS